VRSRLPFAAGLLALLSALAVGGPRPAPAAPASKPSFVVIQTDDETLAGIAASMSNTIELIARKGMTFDNYYVSYPLCCPSRVSLLTGRYAHNHNVRGNIQPAGGFSGFESRTAWSHNLATWLQGAGYRTIHIGKFFNGYGDEPYDDGTVMPPGWDAWHTVLNADTDHYYYGYLLNNDGRIDGPYGDPGSWETREYGVRDDPGCPTAPANGLPCYYITDRLTGIAAEEIAATPRSRSLYLQLDYTSPHGDYRRPAGPEPAPRDYLNPTGKVTFPHDYAEGLNEKNVADKPSFIRDAPPLTAEELHDYGVYWQMQEEALRSVDDGVRAVIAALGRAHRLRNTYVVFTSDNGFFFGEHRLAGGKFLAYEPSTHLPFLIRGPGIRPESISKELTMNIDIAPTLLQLAGATANRSIDGRSLVPLLRHPERKSRRPVLFESFVETSDVEGQGTVFRPRGGRDRAGATASLLAPPKDYTGIRVGPYKYIVWPNGEKELYNLVRDPHELHSLHRVRNLAPIVAFLHRRMLRLRHCAGRSCREWVPKLPLTLRQARRRHGGRHQVRIPPGAGVVGVLRPSQPRSGPRSAHPRR
jgi:N-acetylglucosamine-6-sulfatase